MDNIIRAFISANNADITGFMTTCRTQIHGTSLSLGQDAFLQYGCRLQFGQQSVVYLGWQDGKMMVMPYHPVNDNIVSSPFSGCLFGTFSYNNVDYAVHIATSLTTSDMRNKWENFCKINRNHITNVKIYQPNKDLKHQYVQVWGVISNTGKCYSMGIEKRNGIDDKRCFYIEESCNIFLGTQAYTDCCRRTNWQPNHNRRIF